MQLAEPSMNYPKMLKENKTKAECLTAYAHLDRNINRSHGLPALYWAPGCNREPHNGSTVYNVGLECF